MAHFLCHLGAHILEPFCSISILPKTRYQRLTPGNLLMCLFDIDVTPRCIGLIKDEGLCSPAYSQFVLNKQAYAPYYYYYYLNLDYTKELLHMAKNLRHSLTEDQLGEITVPVPPYEEQRRIAGLLDTKCIQVDTLISNNEAQIEKLKQYKQSLITEVVTKGLDPTVPMKDSGVEWIGEIPEHWDIVKIGQCTSKVGSGKTPSGGAESYSSDGILFLRSQNIYDTGLVLEEPTFISEEVDSEMRNTRVYPYDVLLNITGGSIGRCCIFLPKYMRANVNQHVSIIRVKNSIMTPEYMHKYWISSLGKVAISVYQTGGNREGMSAEAIKKSPMPLPSIQEQMQITNYLDTKCTQIDRLIAIKQAKIEKLNQYKKSLIYEYVTGKKEVVPTDAL